MKKAIIIIYSFLVSIPGFGNIILPKFFADNMVLQRNKPIHIWGWASPGEKITLNLKGQKVISKTDKNGKWAIILTEEPAGGPFEMIIKGRTEITIHNILIGEVWVCSGQSNMEMPIAGWGKIDNYLKEIEHADYPQIRQFEVPKKTSSILQDSLGGGSWKICNPATAGEFSAAAYFFALEIYRELGVPVGLINSTWGGTQSEAWTSQEAFEHSDEFSDIGKKMRALDFETYNRNRYEIQMKNIEKLSQEKIDSAEIKKWKLADFDDSNWGQLKLPGYWEDQGLANLDGVVWFRKSVFIDSADAGEQALLQLAKIDDKDETFVNGIRIGGLNSWDEERKYVIPAGILKPGKNLIAVKVEDDGGNGGIYGDAGNLQIVLKSKTIPLAGPWSFRIALIFKPSIRVGPNDYPSLLYNAMINPLIPLSIQGVIWYQGESNADRAFQYRKAFPLMIKDWQQHWGQGNFPFLFVQLSSYGSSDANSNTGSKWAELREAQLMTLSLPNTGMAVTTDIGNPLDIHPKDKQDVGKRLAAIALHDVYGKEGEFTGPLYQSMQVEDNKIILSFSHRGSGWYVKDKYRYLKGFEIAGADQKFVFAKASIDGERIVVWQETVKKPVAVRYNWSDNASDGNLYNDKKYPAAPFRTDTWKGITEKNKYNFELF